MSCTGCAEKFGFLKKELGCPRCKFSYCKKCLRFQIVDPKTAKTLSVCLKCSQAVEKEIKEPISVMSALHRLESMDDPAKPPITVYRKPMTHAGRLQELKRGLSFEDQKLLERLESLKQDDEAEKKSPNKRRTSEKVEEEIAERLAKLKGEEYNPESKTRENFRNIKPQTEEDIIAKFTTEVELDSKYEASVVNDIEERLARLRGDQPPTAGNSGAMTSGNRLGESSMISPDDEDELPEAEQVEQIMRKLKEELAIEEKFGPPPSEGSKDSPGVEGADQPMEGLDDDDDIDADELCGICSDKRAVLLCKECDDDIFCKACFQELHQELGEMHAAKPFNPKKH